MRSLLRRGITVEGGSKGCGVDLFDGKRNPDLGEAGLVELWDGTAAQERQLGPISYSGLGKQLLRLGEVSGVGERLGREAAHRLRDWADALFGVALVDALEHLIIWERPAHRLSCLGRGQWPSLGQGKVLDLSARAAIDHEIGVLFELRQRLVRDAVSVDDVDLPSLDQLPKCLGLLNDPQDDTIEMGSLPAAPVAL